VSAANNTIASSMPAPKRSAEALSLLKLIP
jgi:hypothetical protein